MQRTKLGIGVGLFGAIIYLTGLLGGLLIPVIIAGYVLIMEDNEWLKKTAVKTVAIILTFSFIIAAFNLIPDTIGTIHNVAAIFGGRLSIAVVSNIVSAIVSILNLLEKIFLLALGYKALNQGNISVPIVDKLLDKYMG